MSHNCNSCTTPVSSVNQTLDELDFERGIWSAALDGDEARVKKLLDKGTDPNSEDKNGYTALHYASRAGHYGVCQILLKAGASVNAVTRAGKSTPLHRAALAGKDQIVDLLLKSNANPKQLDCDGRTALHRAREGNHPNVESQLLSACPDLQNMP